MDCNECGEAAYGCQWCDGRACGCGGTVHGESEHASCGACDTKNMRTHGDFQHFTRRTHATLIPWFPRPQVSFPNGVDQ